jgi:hypothetical protein
MLSGCYAQEQVKDSEVRPAEPKKETNTWDLGEVKKGESITRAFVFKNDAAKTITVASIQTSCGCTGSEIKDKTLASGQTTDVTVKFDSKGYNAGGLEQFIYINTDDTENPVIKYTVKVAVVD